MFTKIMQEILNSGLTEVEAAIKLNTTQATVNRIKNNKQRPGGDLAVAIMTLRKTRERQYRAFLNKAA